MSVNYFDRHVKTEYEKPTVGILLCREKNDSVVELTLPEDTNIYASQYSLYLALDVSPATIIKIRHVHTNTFFVPPHGFTPFDIIRLH